MDRLIDEKTIEKFSINKDKFELFEEIFFVDNYDSVSSKLKKMNNLKDKVILTYLSGESFYLDFDVFVDNWLDFYYPSSDDILIINEKRNWIIYLTHFESFQLGHGRK